MTTIAELKKTLEAAESAWTADSAKIKRLAAYDRVVNEGGEGYSTAEAASEANANKHWPIVKAAQDALFAAVWTAEVTAERRATWNAEMAALIAAKKQATPATITSIQNRLGFTLSDLRKAIGK